MRGNKDEVPDDGRQQKLLKAASSQPVPELYFGTVRAIGTPVGPVDAALRRSLRDAGFEMKTVKLSKAIENHRYTKARRDAKESDSQRYARLERAAVKLREASKHRDAVAVAAIEQVHTKLRARLKSRAERAGAHGSAFLFRNLMHHAEVKRLRRIYDRQFFLISVYSPRVDREANLSENLGDGHRHGGDSLREQARELVASEEEFFPRSRRYERRTAKRREFVTNIPKAFQYGDLFVDAADPNIEQQIDRFVDLIFGHPFHTPTRDEIGMSDAFSAALQSGNLARQVGAAICTEQGDLLATGTNDVPKPGGGVYRSDDELDDYRDHNASPRLLQFRRGFDVSDPMRRSILADLLHRILADPAWLRELDDLLLEPNKLGHKLARSLEQSGRSGSRPNHKVISLEPVVDALIKSDLVWDAQFFDVLEYGRTLHAEMDAITSAARKGASIRGATLYCTTLPCHECARLIVGAGIRRVIYIEPYEKSRSELLFDSEIRLTTLARSRAQYCEDDKPFVDFVPYVGISPRRFSELFAKGDRKRQDQESGTRNLRGDIAEWRKSDGRIRETIISSSAIESPRRLADILDHESQLIHELNDSLGLR